MKSMSFVSIIFISTIIVVSSNSSCMDNGNAISLTGELVIKHYMSQASYKIVKEEIENHLFEMDITAKHCIKERDPFLFEVTMNRKKTRSYLVKHILPFIQSKTNSITNNILFDSVDERIEWKNTETNSDFKLITITASFYNKDTLLKSVDNVYNDHKRLCSKTILQ